MAAAPCLPTRSVVMVAEFLTAAAELYAALASVHQARDDQPAAGHVAPPVEFVDLDVLSERLGETTEALRPAADADVLADACRRVGLELCWKLCRLRDSGAVVGKRVVDAPKLRAVWSSRDVEALGFRLQGLAGQCPDGTVSFQLAVIHHADHSKATPETKSRDEAPGAEDDEAVQDHHGKDTGGKGAPRGRGGLFNAPIAKAKASKPRPAPASLLYDFILDSLAFKSMRDREDEVVQAHASTFEWVFADAPSTAAVGGDQAGPPEADQDGRFRDRFATWLAGDGLGPTYWITGKPGSGKSTFMRFLFHHRLTARHLRAWAGEGRPVQTAGFFFWTSGSREQRSQTGLLRSLLHQLLAADDDTRARIPAAFPALWAKLRCMSTKERVRMVLDWEASELMDAFRRLLDAALPESSICLFVDGLDEFDGDHRAIIDFFKDLGRGPRGRAIKTCLSSRPWAVFEEAFEHAVPHLRLQDLTHDDMCRYVRSRLGESASIRRLLESDARVEGQLVRDTVERADGVFLWVRLAVNEMMGCFRPGSPDSSSLSGTLAQLPTELDSLFDKLLFHDQTAAQLAETAALFGLVRAREVVADFVRDDAANSLTVWELAFALDAADDSLALEAVVEEASDAFIHERCAATVARIRQRSAGLLDMHGAPRQGNARVPRYASGTAGDDARAREGRATAAQRVTYIHRTVRDWLTTADGVSERLEAASPADADTHLRLLRSYVLRLKRPLEEVEHHRRLDEWWPDIALALTHARYVAFDDAQGLLRRFVKALDGTLGWLWLRREHDAHDHWARSAFGAYEVRMKAPPIRRPFLCLATKFGLTRYVCEEVDVLRRQEVDAENDHLDDDNSDNDDEDHDDDGATPLLAYATEFLCSRKTTIFPLSDPALVEHLLATPCRANPGPDHAYRDFATRKPTTPWLALLRHLRDARRRGWVAYYDVDPAGTRRWVCVVRAFVEVGGADVAAVVVADAWDPAVSAVGVLEMLERTYGAVEVTQLRELMVRMRDEGAGGGSGVEDGEVEGCSGVKGNSGVENNSGVKDNSGATNGTSNYVLRLTSRDMPN